MLTATDDLKGYNFAWAYQRQDINLTRTFFTLSHLHSEVITATWQTSGATIMIVPDI